MMPEPPWKFSEWYTAQFGEQRDERNDDELRAIVAAGDAARAELHRREIARAREAGALAAWCVSSKNKVVP